MNLRLPLKELEGSFDIEKAVCNHGFFMMAPNVWNPKTKSLSRPLRLSNSSSVNVTISHPAPHPFLVIQVHGINNVSRVDEDLILHQVGRMLRISDKDERDVTEFQKLHEDAKKSNFGRIFRSPSLFEDIVKSILLCNTTWNTTLGMASQLCELQSKLADGTFRAPSPQQYKKRILAPEPRNETGGNFPSAKEIASLNIELISEHCKLGYRADLIHKLAEKVESGSLNLGKIESREMEAEKITRKLRTLTGFGAFVTSTVLMCIGHYRHVTSDTETLRLLREMHGKEEYSKETIEKEAQSFYDRFSPFQCLAYWFDLIQNYEAKLGKLSELDPSEYKNASGCSHMPRDAASAVRDHIASKVCLPKKPKRTKFILALEKASSKKRPRKDYTCSRCHQGGHNCKTCKVPI